jgi:hypothetical protein
MAANPNPGFDEQDGEDEEDGEMPDDDVLERSDKGSTGTFEQSAMCAAN